MPKKKTTIQSLEKNPIRKNYFLVFFCASLCLLTVSYDAGNPNNSGKKEKNRKNKTFLAEILPFENKNTKFVKSEKFSSKKCLKNPPPLKN